MVTGAFLLFQLAQTWHQWMNSNFCSIFYHFVYPPSISNLSVMKRWYLQHSWYIPQTLERYCDVPECQINQNHYKEVRDKEPKTVRTLKTLLKRICIPWVPSYHTWLNEAWAIPRLLPFQTPITLTSIFICCQKPGWIQPW